MVVNARINLDEFPTYLVLQVTFSASSVPERMRGVALAVGRPVG